MARSTSRDRSAGLRLRTETAMRRPLDGRMPATPSYRAHLLASAAAGTARLLATGTQLVAPEFGLALGRSQLTAKLTATDCRSAPSGCSHAARLNHSLPGGCHSSTGWRPPIHSAEGETLTATGLADGSSGGVRGARIAVWVGSPELGGQVPKSAGLRLAAFVPHPAHTREFRAKSIARRFARSTSCAF
jgi:hypothetical protein